MTRLQTLQAQDATPDLPALGLASHLVGYLFDAGPVSSGAMGAVPLGWSDLQHWQSATGIELQTWEARALRRLSQEYLSSSTDAQETDCPAPWSNAPTVEQRTHISNALRNIFGGLRKH